MFRSLLIATVLFLSGCASTTMVKGDNQLLTNKPADQSQVIFMRSSFVGGAISASVFDVTDGEPAFIGILDNDTKLAFNVKPGKRTFMVVSEAADYLEANLVSGKTFYAVVTPRMGMWKARFSMYPVSSNATAEFKHGEKRIEKMKTSTVLMVNSEKSNAWFNANLKDIKAKHAEYWPNWKSKPSADVAERTLVPADGV